MIHIQYKEEVREINERWRTYVDNKFKAYAYIFGQYNKPMQTRLENDSKFESEVKGDPFKMMKAIKLKIHDPSKVKCPFVTVFEQLDRL